ncbi:MAG: PAS domain-containing protein [Actinomycetota bacterium]|nr:PAS domain-containing protein [Actinomycetota bacterium]
MRQWELIGITDSQPEWTPPRATDVDRVLLAAADRSVFFWTTDAAMRLRTVTESAAENIGRTTEECEGRYLAELVGPEGIALLEAHVTALNGRTATFTLKVDRGTVRCRVAPTKDTTGDVVGTFCLAVSWDDVDLRDRRPSVVDLRERRSSDAGTA